MNMLITTPFGKHPWTSVSRAAVPDADQHCLRNAERVQKNARRSPTARPV